MNADFLPLSPTGLFFLLGGTAVVSWWGVRLVVRHARRLGLVDVPNHRSSHVEPTPRGGGLGILAGILFSGVGLLLLGGPQSGVLEIAFLTALVGAVGLWDDIRSLPVWPRLLVQWVVCGAAVAIWPGEYALLASAVLIAAGVWWLNLFNFMDGIDGLAGSQALFMLSAATGLSWLFNADVVLHPGWWWLLFSGAAVLAFLAWNWPPAKVFMGDVGSNSLGFILFAFALMSVTLGWLSWTAWMILGALFIVDATLTLLIRMRRGEAWLEAHRQHAYQLLALRCGSHAFVTRLALAINMAGLASLAYLALLAPHYALAIMGLTYAALVLAILIWRKVIAEE